MRIDLTPVSNKKESIVGCFYIYGCESNQENFK